VLRSRVHDTRVILLDIEGTTTPIAFVTETLFPYARTHLTTFLEREGGSSEVVGTIERLRREFEADDEARGQIRGWSVIAYAEWLMDRDRKSAALKDLQGRIWQDGYRNGSLAGQVFEDAARALARWHAAGVPVAIYSSGSVLAQQWLFRTCEGGDLTPLIRWHFDTAVGGKRDPASYTRIADMTGVAAAKITFVSDIVAELDAARAAGLRTVLSVRPGNARQPPHDHRIVTSFDEIELPSA